MGEKRTAAAAPPRPGLPQRRRPAWSPSKTHYNDNVTAAPAPVLELIAPLEKAASNMHTPLRTSSLSLHSALSDTLCAAFISGGAVVLALCETVSCGAVVAGAWGSDADIKWHFGFALCTLESGVFSPAVIVGV